MSPGLVQRTLSFEPSCIPRHRPAVLDAWDLPEHERTVQIEIGSV